MENNTFPLLIPIKWEPDYYTTYNYETREDEDDVAPPNSITLFSHYVSRNEFKLTLRKLETSSLKKKLCGYSLLMEISLELRRSPGDLPLKALNVQGSIFFIERKTHRRLADKSFKYFFKEDEEAFSFGMDISRQTLPERWREVTEIPFPWNIHGYISFDYPYMETDQYCFQSCHDREIHKLSNDFQFLGHEENQFSDINIKCCGVTLFAHRVILATRSPVFKAMLQKSMKEYETGVIEITDMKPDIVKIMLKYIYCAQIDELTEDTACDLLYAADKYELLDLKEMCVSYLKHRISNDNVLCVLKLAVLHDDDLKLHVLDHIDKNFMEIEKSNGWNDLRKQNPDLVMDILSKIVKFK